MILHHYEISPFSEKIRLMFGYAGLPWRSLLSPAMPPRPNIDPLSGGYRRIPLMQIGADIFCDTRIIAQEIAAASNLPELDIYQCQKEAQEYAAYVDQSVFLAMVFSIPNWTALKRLAKTIGPREAIKFLFDRVGIILAAKTKIPFGTKAERQFEFFLNDLEKRLISQYVFGEKPCHADFSVYHVLWFRRVVAAMDTFKHLPRVEAWYNRMTEFGHHQYRSITKEDAFQEAKNTETRAVELPMSTAGGVGLPFSAAPSDYARNRTAGILVGASEHKIIIERDTKEFGPVHVHFPKDGYELL